MVFKEQKAKPLILKDTLKATLQNKKLHITSLLDEPNTLYKYYSLKSYNISGIENNSIYFSQVNLLNDILEGDFEKLWNFEDFNKNDNFISDHKKYIINNIETYKKEILQYRSIFSMCDNYKNDLLWVHYTQESGYCLEIDKNELINFFKNKYNGDFWFYPIHYPQNLEQINFNKHVAHEKHQEGTKGEIKIELPVFYGLSTKEHHWHYEREWRILLRNRKFNYITNPTQIIDDTCKEIEEKENKGGNIEIPNGVIKKIILAPRFFNNARFNIYKKQNNIETFHFKNNEEGRLSYKLLKAIYKKHPNTIYQINKTIKKNILEREITTSIHIIDIQESYVKIIREEIT